MTRADLHLHTVYSDGCHTPEEVAKLAKERGMSLISFTDHDSMEGEAEKKAAAEKYGLLRVRGWEISAYLGDCKVHVLGYNCDMGGTYSAFLAERREAGAARAEESLKKANKALGTDLTLDDVERFHTRKSAPLHTMHVVRAFAERLGKDPILLYRELFSAGGAAYSALGRPTPFEALDTIRAMHGFASLAHPGCIRLPFGERERLMDTLAERGLGGIECTHTLHTGEETEYFKRYAESRGLLKTGGSDFHKTGTDRVLGLPPFYADDGLLEVLLTGDE